MLTIQELSDDFLKLLVKHRIRILDRLQEFTEDDIGFGRKGGRKGFAGFVSRHTVALNCLEKGCTNAVKVTVVVLQSFVVILAGLEIVRDDCGAMIGEDAQEDPVQKELCVAMHALA